MTSPRSPYGGGYSAAFPDTPIYDSLVAERGTPQIAPIRVPPMYDTPSYDARPSYDHGGGHLPALPALPSGPSYQPQPPAPSYGYPQAQPALPAVHAALPPAPSPVPAPYIPQQASGSRGYAAPQQQPPRPAPHPGTGYEAMRPAAARPAPAPAPAPQAPYGQQAPYNGSYGQPAQGYPSQYGSQEYRGY
ncbi:MULTISPECIES: DUF6643 family protein [Streptomyces]|uniref:DUF6643 family protein n=1 Tax=Streptomyces TaxID=1883 RepID=UPI001408B7EA|nr:MULTISPECIES: DUF6643 family protein [Streptomyces]